MNPPVARRISVPLTSITEPPESVKRPVGTGHQAGSGLVHLDDEAALRGEAKIRALVPEPRDLDPECRAVADAVIVGGARLGIAQDELRRHDLLDEIQLAVPHIGPSGEEFDTCRTHGQSSH